MVNEFTKNELELMSNLLHFVLATRVESKETYEFIMGIHGKIKHMMENYCEHICTDDGPGLEQICRDCGRSSLDAK